MPLHPDLSFQRNLPIFTDYNVKASSLAFVVMAGHPLCGLLIPPFPLPFCLLLACLSPGHVLDRHHVSLRFLIHLCSLLNILSSFQIYISYLSLVHLSVLKNIYHLQTFKCQSIFSRINFLDNRRLSTLPKLFPSVLRAVTDSRYCFIILFKILAVKKNQECLS